MANQLDKSTLQYLGEDFQYKLIKEFMERKGFFENLISIIDQNAFTSTYLRSYVGTMLNYYKKHNIAPSYSAMKIEMHQMANTDTDIEIYDGILDKIHKTTCDGSDQVTESALRFFKQQRVIKIANKLLEQAAKGDVDYFAKHEDELRNVLNIGLENDYEESCLFDGLDDVLSKDFRTTIPTGIDLIDRTLNGGIGTGELGVIIGPSGFGKTSMTTSMALHAAGFKSAQNNFQGFKVMQIVFEDQIKQIKRKHFSKITQVEACNLSKEEYAQEVRAILDTYEDKETIQNNLRIIRLKSGTKTVDFIEKLIKEHINKGFRPDIVFLDYFECLKMSGNSAMTKWEKETETMRKIEAMVNEYNIAFWVPVQGNRESINTEVVTMDNAGGSLGKVQIAHIIMSITRSKDDIQANIATVSVLKNRAGSSGNSFEGIGFNNGTCTITASPDGGCMGGIDFGRPLQSQQDQSLDEMQKGLMAEIYASTTKNNKKNR